MSAHRLKIAPASRFIRVWRSDVGHNHWIRDGPTPGQRLPDTIESLAEPRLTVLSFVGAIGGAQVVRITGYDGITKGERVEGQPLFPDSITTIDLPAKAATIDFDVPAAADKPQKPTGPTVLPKR